MKTPNRAGPKGTGADVRAALLSAGCALYEERGLEGISLRDVADRAGVNQAMVRYYFTDKKGFEAAMLDTGFNQVIAALPDEDDFEKLFAAAINAMIAMPWMPLLVMRTIYINDTLRQTFMENYAPRLLNRLGRVLNTDASLTILSTASMLIFPQLARRVIGPMLNLTYDDEFARTYAAHVSGLLKQQ